MNEEAVLPWWKYLLRWVFAKGIGREFVLACAILIFALPAVDDETRKTIVIMVVTFFFVRKAANGGGGA